jgi:hypothetical protein
VFIRGKVLPSFPEIFCTHLQKATRKMTFFVILDERLKRFFSPVHYSLAAQDLLG